MLSRKRFFSIFLFILVVRSLCLAAYYDYGLEPVSDEAIKDQKTRNVAIWHFGASLIKVEDDGRLSYYSFRERDDSSEYALLAGDPSYVYNLQSGLSRFIVDLGADFPVEEFVVKSFSMSGQVRIYGSRQFHVPDSKKWQELGRPVPIMEGEHINMPLGFSEVRYLMVQLESQAGGEISSFSFIGPTTSRAPNNRTVEELKEYDGELVPFNYAQTNEGARIRYVSSGTPPKANTVLDEDFEDPYEFEKSDDQALMILDLDQERAVNGLSLLFQSDPGTFNFIFLDELPEGLEEQVIDDIGELESSLDSSFLWHRPDPSVLLAATEGSFGEFVTLGELRDIKDETDFLEAVEDSTRATSQKVDGSETRVQISFEDISSRYVVIVWERDPNSEEVNPLRIYQVNVIGDVPLEDIIGNPVSVFQFQEGGSLIDDGDDIGPGDDNNVINDNPPVVPPIVPSPPPVISQ